MVSYAWRDYWNPWGGGGDLLLCPPGLNPEGDVLLCEY